MSIRNTSVMRSCTLVQLSTLVPVFVVAWSRMSSPRTPHPFDLAAAALEELHTADFHPEFSAAATEQTREIAAHPLQFAPAPHLQDLRTLPWSSIDNDTSRDLDVNYMVVARRLMQMA